MWKLLAVLVVFTSFNLGAASNGKSFKDGRILITISGSNMDENDDWVEVVGIAFKVTNEVAEDVKRTGKMADKYNKSRKLKKSCPSTLNGGWNINIDKCITKHICPLKFDKHDEEILYTVFILKEDKSDTLKRYQIYKDCSWTARNHQDLYQSPLESEEDSDYNDNKEAQSAPSSDSTEKPSTTASNSVPQDYLQTTLPSGAAEINLDPINAQYQPAYASQNDVSKDSIVPQTTPVEAVARDVIPNDTIEQQANPATDPYNAIEQQANAGTVPYDAIEPQVYPGTIAYNAIEPAALPNVPNYIPQSTSAGNDLQFNAEQGVPQTIDKDMLTQNIGVTPIDIPAINLVPEIDSQVAVNNPTQLSATDEISATQPASQSPAVENRNLSQLTAEQYYNYYYYYYLPYIYSQQYHPQTAYPNVGSNTQAISNPVLYNPNYQQYEDPQKQYYGYEPTTSSAWNRGWYDPRVNDGLNNPNWLYQGYGYAPNTVPALRSGSNDPKLLPKQNRRHDPRHGNGLIDPKSMNQKNRPNIDSGLQTIFYNPNTHMKEILGYNLIPNFGSNNPNFQSKVLPN